MKETKVLMEEEALMATRGQTENADPMVTAEKTEQLEPGDQTVFREKKVLPVTKDKSATRAQTAVRGSQVQLESLVQSVLLAPRDPPGNKVQRVPKENRVFRELLVL